MVRYQQTQYQNKIMAQGTFRLTDATFKGTGETPIYCPQSVLDCWRVPPKPTEDAEGNPLAVTPYTFKEAHDAASLGSAPYFPIVHEVGKVPERTEEGVTHWMIPVNNVDMDVFHDCDVLAAAEAVPRSHVYMPINKTLIYLATGTL